MHDFTKIEEFLAPRRRQAYVPLFSRDVIEGVQSRYFGRPWMPTDMEWPCVDEVPMNFVLQLDLAALPWRPEGFPDRGLLLFFTAEEYDAPEIQSFVTIVDDSSTSSLRSPPEDVRLNPPMEIVGWRTIVDIPHFETLLLIDGFDGLFDDDLLEEYGRAPGNKILGVDGNSYTESSLVASGVTAVGHTFRGDKLGGWPSFEQGDETPRTENGKPWQYLMQVAYNGFRQKDFDLSDVEWPTWGTGHIFRDPVTGKLIYIWACD